MTTTTIYPRPWKPSTRERLDLDWSEAKETVGDLVKAVSFFATQCGEAPPRLPVEVQAPLVRAVHDALDREDEQGFEVAVGAWRAAWDRKIDKFIGTEEAQAATKRRTPRP